MKDYRLLDCGQGRKLEVVGPYRLDRQAPAAVWKKRLPRQEWKDVAAEHLRDERGGGHWRQLKDIPTEWQIHYGGMEILVKPTPFGHLGFFAEQKEQWAWIEQTVRARVEAGRATSVLNLFAYTGLSSLAAAKGGAQVCHVDAAKGIVDWARRHAELNGLKDRPIRWIVEDALRFVQREAQRGRHYDGIILDPPSYGRGAKQEIWRIEEHLPPLLEALAGLLSKDPAFVLLSGHTPGWTETVLGHLICDAFGELFQCHGGEMLVRTEDGRALPAGHYTRATPRT